MSTLETPPAFGSAGEQEVEPVEVVGVGKRHRYRDRRYEKRFRPLGEDWGRLWVVARMNGMSRSQLVGLLVHELCENPRILRLK